MTLAGATQTNEPDYKAVHAPKKKGVRLHADSCLPAGGRAVNIYQRINEVRKKVDYAKKDKAVEGYKAVTHDQITALTREHLVEHGIVIVPILASQSTELTGTQTKGGTPFVRWQGSYRFDVVNAEDPADHFIAEIGAHAIDHGDKAPGKALSYAKKALILKLMEIESGDDDEGREEQHKPKESKVTPNAGAGDNMTEKQKSMIRDTKTMIGDALDEDRDHDAYALCESLTELEDKLYLWSLMDSKQRRRIKEQQKREQESEPKLKAV